ncbi:MAG: tetratricopeptide repeat protein [Alphaproteobacteria bacterium]
MSVLRTALLICALALALPAAAQETAPPAPEEQLPPGDLYEALAAAESPVEARIIEQGIYAEWAHTESPSVGLIAEQAGALLGEGDLKRSREKLTALTEVAPDFAEGWRLRAVIHRKQGDFPAAVSDLRRVLEIEPRHFLALVLLASIFEDMEQYKPALKAWEAALEINPHLEGGAQTVRRLTDKVKGRGI